MSSPRIVSTLVRPWHVGVADDVQVMEDGYVMVRTRHQPFPMTDPWCYINGNMDPINIPPLC